MNGRSPRSDVGTLLGTWRAVEPGLLELRRIHARALAQAVARRCVERSGAGLSPGVLPADLLERASEATWTAPDVAFAHYVQLQRDALSERDAGEIIASLLEVCSRPAPPPVFRDNPSRREWKAYGLRTMVDDYRRDGRDLELRLAEPDERDVEHIEAAHQILTRTWPEMARTVDALVREVVWYDRSEGARSGTLIQAYGAVFAARGQPLAQVLELLVHETTHLEVIARFALDKALVRPLDRDTSPFRQRPRPLSRVLHAAMVAARNVEALDRSMDELPASERDRAVVLRHKCAESLGTALGSLERAEWTPLGAPLLEDLKSHRARVRPAPA